MDMDSEPPVDSFDEPEDVTRELTAELSELEELSLDPHTASTPQSTRKAPKKSRKRGVLEVSEAFDNQWKKLKKNPKSVCSCPVFLLEQHWSFLPTVEIDGEYLMSELKAMLQPLLDAKEICLFHLSVIASKLGLTECRTQEGYTSRLVRVMNILGDSDDISLAVCHANTRSFFKASFIEEHGSRSALENESVMWRFHPDLSVNTPAEADKSVEAGIDMIDLSWITQLIGGVRISDIFMMELEMYLYHFQIQYLKNGYLPVYFSLAQQFVRQEPRIHLFHVQADPERQVEMIAIPSPLRFRTRDNFEHGIQYIGALTSNSDERYRNPCAELLITRGKPVQIEQFVPSDDSLRKWILSQKIINKFICL
jgi:hypothetical protein